MEKKNGFHQPENQLSTSNNKLFLRLFTPNSNNGFYQQPNSSDQKNTFSAKQNIRFHQPDEGY